MSKCHTQARVIALIGAVVAAAFDGPVSEAAGIIAVGHILLHRSHHFNLQAPKKW